MYSVLNKLIDGFSDLWYIGFVWNGGVGIVGVKEWGNNERYFLKKYLEFMVRLNLEFLCFI